MHRTRHHAYRYYKLNIDQKCVRRCLTYTTQLAKWRGPATQPVVLTVVLTACMNVVFGCFMESHAKIHFIRLPEFGNKELRLLPARFY